MTPLLHAVTTILSPERNKPLSIPGEINGDVELLFTVDTGAEVSTAPLDKLRGKVKLTGETQIAYGAGGHAIYLQKTEPLQIRLGPHVVEASLWLGEVNALLGIDVLASREASLDFKKDGSVVMRLNELALQATNLNELGPQDNGNFESHPVWSRDAFDCGLLHDVEPVSFKGTPPPYTPQYKLSEEAIKGLQGQIHAYLDRGVLRRAKSASNSPVWPIVKSTGEYRLVVDYRIANKLIEKIPARVSDPTTVYSRISPEHAWFSCVDLCNAFHSVRIASEIQPWFAFTVNSVQYTFQRLAQGQTNSPGVFHEALRKHLNELPPHNSVVIQYVDDILLCSKSKAEHLRDLSNLLDHLHQRGHKAGFHKAQLCREEVIFLGQKISQGKREIVHNRKRAIAETPPPRTIKALRAFLGLANYNRQWICDFAEISGPLNALLKGTRNSREKIELDAGQLQSFQALKEALCSAPALGFVDPEKPFVMHVIEERGYMKSVLLQHHQDKLRAVGYYSAKLDIVALGYPPCLRACQAVVMAVEMVQNVVLDQMLVVKCPHGVQTLMTTQRASQVTTGRWARWTEVLEKPGVYIEKGPVLNMAALLAETEASTDSLHACDCEAAIQAAEDKMLQRTEPLKNPDLVLYTDGSSTCEDGVRRAGWAVTTETDVILSGALPPGTSAQQAELKALIEGLKYAKGKSVTIHTDSRYCQGAVTNWADLWRQRDFLTAAGTPIKNAELIRELLEVVTLPKEVAVVKTKAHGPLNTPEALGNSLADETARAASKLPPLQLATVQIPYKIETLKDIGVMQKETDPEEVWKWMGSGAKLCDDGLWRKDDRLVAPQKLLPYLAAQIHSVGHIGLEQMVARFSRVWWGLSFRKEAKEVLGRCVACLKVNPGSKILVPMRRTPAPCGPWLEIQQDYIVGLPKCKGYKDLLVIVDKFSRWVECYPTSTGTARHVVKVLSTDIIPRWGVPQIIDSDRGATFTAQVCEELGKLLGYKLKFHTPFHPQSSGHTERKNKDVKRALEKYHAEGIPWPDALPWVLASLRGSVNKDIGLSPFEIIFGRPMNLPGAIDLRTADVHLTSDTVLQYCENLTKAVSAAHSQVKEAWGEEVPGGHSMVPGMYVMVKKFVRRSLDPHWEGPYQILLVTNSALRLAGRKNWIHASSCKLAPFPTDP